ncbi:hypothetical protein K438DRAFT_775516 [Mycena galopus ATCC 62051]|nr:hypothetical protein K438DRAFT_775516 [Mycena galopus ATCC 62051]
MTAFEEFWDADPSTGVVSFISPRTAPLELSACRYKLDTTRRPLGHVDPMKDIAHVDPMKDIALTCRAAVARRVEHFRRGVLWLAKLQNKRRSWEVE